MMLRFSALTVFFALAGFGLSLAQDAPEINCDDAMAQQERNICAYRDFDVADAELNAQYRLTKQAMAKMDEALDANLRGAAKALLVSQRAWIAYRDGQCDAEGFQVRGGSMEQMFVADCKATLTRRRTAELKELANGMEN